MTLSSFVLLGLLDAAVDVSCVRVRSARVTSSIDELPDRSQESCTDTEGHERVLLSVTLEILPIPSHGISFVAFNIHDVFSAKKESPC